MAESAFVNSDNDKDNEAGNNSNDNDTKNNYEDNDDILLLLSPDREPEQPGPSQRRRRRNPLRLLVPSGKRPFRPLRRLAPLPQQGSCGRIL